MKKHLIFLALLICSHLFAEYSKGNIEKTRKPTYGFGIKNYYQRILPIDQARYKDSSIRFNY